MDRLDWEDRGNTRWIRLEGEIDHDSYDRIAPEFRKVATGAKQTVVVDFSGVTFVSSNGIRLLLGIHHDLRKDGRSVHVSGLNSQVRKVFETTMLFEAIPEWEE